MTDTMDAIDGDVRTLMELRAGGDPRTIEEMIDEDQFEDVVLTSARVTAGASEDGAPLWALEWDGAGVVLRGFVEPGPKAGDTVRLYSRGLGSTTHGWALNGWLVYWDTPWERFADRVKWLANYDREKRESFARDKDKLDEDYKRLPDALKARIDRFRRESASFRIDDESYEMFACVEAAKFAERARVAVVEGSNAEEVDDFWSWPVGEINYDDRGKHVRKSGTVWQDEPEDKAQRWLLWAWALNDTAYDYDHERQHEILGHDEGHSGNTFGGAMSLAAALLAGKDV